MGFISKFILPKEVDFYAALQAQARITRTIVEDLHTASIDDNPVTLAAISAHADEARALKTKNMKDLLDVFITPFDKESIYRIITQMDWIALSIKHLHLETEAYGISSIREYRSIIEILLQMAALLEKSVNRLSAKNPKVIAPDIDLIHDKYDNVVTSCAQAMAERLRQDDFKLAFIHKDILAQLKEIAKRIHVTADTLEDMAIKIV